MSALLPTSQHRTPEISRPSKPQRVLACVVCQQRKVKCDRKVPCINCIKSRVQCVPATLAPRRRRRRFPERELLERLHKYEELLRHNNIKFEPLENNPAGEKESPNTDGGYDLDDEHPESMKTVSSSSPTASKSEKIYEAKNLWHTLNQGFRDVDNDSDSSHDDLHDSAVEKSWGENYEINDYLLFGACQTSVDISTLHPEPVHIFKLWQIYLDNVDPLLKVTHNPSLQARIIEAVSNVSNISPVLEALMFSIYCMSTLSLVDDCQAMFGSSKEDLVTKYQFGCQQALLNCGFLRSGDRDCLTALYLYLVSVSSRTIPRSLSSILGVGIRIAQRMGIDSESALAKCTILEAEMRRRLWWSLMLFDTRIGELALSKTTTLAPTWYCRVPLNVNDSDLRPEMKELPAVHGRPSEALFAVVRSELGDFVRHTMFHLDFTGPALKPVAKNIRHSSIPEGSELVILEKMIEDKYLKFCDPENSLHFMTIWTTRTYFARCRLVEHLSRLSSTSVPQTEAQRDDAISYALSMLECDTRIMTSPLTKGFLWLVNFQFPFPAYIQIVQDLGRRPDGNQAEKAWRIMSDNYEARFFLRKNRESPFFKIFTKIILQAWEASELVFRQPGKSLVPPRIVSSIRQSLAQMEQKANVEQLNAIQGLGIDDFPSSTSMPMDFVCDSLLYSLGGQDGYTPNIPGHAAMGVVGNQFDWAAIDWALLDDPASEAAQTFNFTI